MTGTMLLLGFIFVVWGLAYINVPGWVWSATMALIAISATQLVLSPVTEFLIWFGLLFFAAFAHIAPLRRQFITKPVYLFLKKALPPMSETEREAIEAGDVWIEGDLFQGAPQWEAYQALPKPSFTAKEQAFLDGPLQILCAMLDDWHITHERFDLPPAVWDFLKREQFFAMNIPESLGGLGFSAYMQSTVITTLGTRSGTAAVTAMVPNSLGPAELLMHYGTQAQQDKYLARLADGRDIPCFGLTAASAGSDAGAIPDTGVVGYGMHEGENVLGIRLTFAKRYITLAPVATLIGLAFKLRDPDHHLGQTTELGITLCLLERDTPGLNIGQRHMPIGVMFLNGPISGENIFIPMSAIIGGEPMIGQGWRMLVECLSVGRGISLPALATASSQMSTRTTGAYAALREQFKTPIGLFEGVQAAMGRIGGLTYCIEAARRLTALGVDIGKKPAIASAIAKSTMTEMGRVVINDAMDIHAGRSIMLGPKNYLAASFASSVVSITVEGANILTRCLIIFGQGAIRCHPYVQKEMLASHEADFSKGLSMLDGVLFEHLRYGLSNFARTIGHGLTGSRLAKAHRTDEMSKYTKQIDRMSTSLAFVSDLSMLVLGGTLKRKENLSARLGDVLSAMYLSVATLKYYDDEGCRSEDKPFVHWVLQTKLYEAQEAFYGFCENLPFKRGRSVLLRLLFPYGRSFSKPSDELASQIALKMMAPGGFRDRLTSCVYFEESLTDPIGSLEMAFKQHEHCKPLIEKLKQAVREGALPKDVDTHTRIDLALASHIIDETEAQALRQLDAYVTEAIAVDAFDAKLLCQRKMTVCQNMTEAQMSTS